MKARFGGIMKSFYGEMFKRKDGKFAWRLRSASNSKIVATDGAQGYTRSIDCETIFKSIFPGITLQTVVGGQNMR